MSAAVAGGSPESRRRRDRGVDGERTAEEPPLRIKVESDADIKDYAETTMNELLGWYGYDKLDTRGLNLKTLNHHFPTSSSSSSPLRADEDISEEDTGRSRSPHPETESAKAANTNGGTIICAWCLKTGLKLFTLKTSSGETKVFCSEPCFNQCRRAAFKKNHVCNWCRHVRHTVNYVDFQDGDDQLQFCSDKCLNQYKMQIFCKETQAYLQMNPHLQEETHKNSGGTGSKLITPDLWLRDCQEPVNGGGAASLSQSEDEMTPSNTEKSGNGSELEDLTVTTKPDRSNLPGSNTTTVYDRDISHEIRKNSQTRDRQPTEQCNTLASYLRDERDKSVLERKKRLHETEREHARKRQRISSMRNRTHHPEAPPAHLSSAAHTPLSLQNQSRVFPSSISPYPPTLNTTSPSPLNPPAAHTNTLQPHPAITGSLLPPGLPPPPPLLNNDFMHSPFNPSLFQSPVNPLSQQQQLDALLRMQSSMRHGVPLPPHLFHESMLPAIRGTPHPPNSSTVMQPNTVMLPYPIFVPLPVPIPIPIPLSSFLPKEKKPTNNGESGSADIPHSPDKHDCVHLDSESNSPKIPAKTNSSTNVYHTENILKGEKQVKAADTSSYAVTNNDSQTHRLILTRNKTR